MAPHKIVTSFIALILMAFIIHGCRKDKDTVVDPSGSVGCNVPDTVTFIGDIQAITATRCAISGCHTGINPTAGLRLDSYSQVRSIATSGDMAYRALVRQDMPPTGPLSDCEQDLIQAWINQGVQEF